jgi:hypothetical protein
MPQPGADPIGAGKVLLTFQKCDFGRVTPERICRWSEVRAIQLYDPVRAATSSTFRVPFYSTSSKKFHRQTGNGR